MIKFSELKTTLLRESTGEVRRQDIRVDPNSPQLGPYYIVLAHYDGILTEENQDTLIITRLERDKHRIDDFSELEYLVKERAEDPFDPRRRSLNGKEAVWKLPDQSTRFHITSDALINELPSGVITIEALQPSLKFPSKKQAESDT